MSRAVESLGSGRLVRPYTMTGGRTAANITLALEALVATTTAGLRMSGQLRWEAAEIVMLTQHETAVIELAALVDVPIGVIRVLIGDLYEIGAVTIIDPPSEATVDHEGHTDLLQRVLDGIKSL